ncbi:MAG: esterase-like activity of phytase family protein [Alphaproteobacteria bacterium]|nr:esterase-like activity of phytase family protein [Alphaproteobacteria bacterium]
MRALPRKKVPAGVLEALGESLIVEAAFALSSEQPSFGGLSGLWLSPDGAAMIAISDIGQRWQARLFHDDAGRLVGLKDWSVTDLPLRSEEGSGTRWIDSEALAGLGRDGLVVAYEGEHRLRRWSQGDLDAMPERLPLPDGLGDPSNSGIEALSTLENGRLFALAERVGAYGGEGLMGWVIDDSTAEDLVYIPGPGFAPTGAARLEKTIYVVERQFSLLGGFMTRIVTLPTQAIRPGARLQGSELAAFRWGDIGENFEAIAARRGPDGRVFLYLLADDNFSFFQETLLVQLSLSTKGLID